MASVASQLIEEVTAHAQRDSLEDARKICADGTYFLNNLCTYADEDVYGMNECSPSVVFVVVVVVVIVVVVGQLISSSLCHPSRF